MTLYNPFITIELKIITYYIKSNMAERLVRQSKKGSTGEILVICNHGETWSPRYKYDIIDDIENNLHTYFMIMDGKRIQIKVLNDKTGKHLVTDPETTIKNNLLDLPDC